MQMIKSALGVFFFLFVMNVEASQGKYDALVAEIETYCGLDKEGLKINQQLLPSRAVWFFENHKQGTVDLTKVAYAGLIRLRGNLQLKYLSIDLRPGSMIGNILTVQANFCGLARLSADPSVRSIEDGSGSVLEVLP